MEGYITYTTGSGGTWVAWHTQEKPPENATGRDMMSAPGPVSFAIGPTSEVALGRLHADLSIHYKPGSTT